MTVRRDTEYGGVGVLIALGPEEDEATTPRKPLFLIQFLEIAQNRPLQLGIDAIECERRPIVEREGVTSRGIRH